MTISRIGKKIKIRWVDALHIFPGVPKGQGGAAASRKFVPTKMETTGILHEEREAGFVVKDPRTIKVETGESYPGGDRQPTFYFIPHGMVESVEYK